MKKLLAFVLLLPSISMATELEIGLGQSSYNLRSDGIWYQLGNPHTLNTHSQAFQIGLQGEWTNNLDWHVDYVNLGRLSSSCECATMDDLYDAKVHHMIGEGPMARYIGSGSAQGIKLALAPYFREGPAKYGFEAGLFPYRPTWNETVYHWSQSIDGPFVNGSHNTPRAIQLGTVAGAFVNVYHFTLSYEHYWLTTRFDDKHSPAIWTGFELVGVGLGPLQTLELATPPS